MKESENSSIIEEDQNTSKNKTLVEMINYNEVNNKSKNENKNHKDNITLNKNDLKDEEKNKKKCCS